MAFSQIEKKIFKKYQVVAGIDEAGRGPLAGPVVAGVVCIKISKGLSLEAPPRTVLLKPLRDSKQLSEKQREEIFEAIKNDPRIEWWTSAVWPKTIDRINIWQATLLAWQRCLKKLNPQPGFLFLDGKFDLFGNQESSDFKDCPWRRLQGQSLKKPLKLIQKPIIKGDQKIFLLALASIMAKVTRDRLMKKLDKKYPQYALAQHKGYGTKLHLAKLKKYGPCLIHRRSFRPVFATCPFKEKVYYLVKQISRGQVMSYQQLAEKIGHPKAYRAVGHALNQNTDAKIPCHRVIRSDGKIGGYSRGTKTKEKLLKKEKAI